MDNKCISYVRESFFVSDDKNNSDYSFEEFDFYVKISKNSKAK